MTATPAWKVGEIRPEMELVLRTARPGAVPANDARIVALLGSKPAWDSVLGSARSHGTLPLLHWHLGRQGWEGVPALVRASLRDEFRRNATLNLLRTAELLRLLRRFEARGIPALPFKGPTLAAYAYGDLSLRQFNDLDLLLRPDDLAAGRDVLSEDGYIPHLELPEVRCSDYLRTVGQVPCYRTRDASLVELHARLMPRSFYFPLSIEKLSQRAESLNLQGEVVRVLSAEDLLLVLSAHGAKHRFACLGWVSDLAALLHGRPALDLAQALDRARKLRSERLLLLGLRLGYDLLQAAPPAVVGRRLRRDPMAGRLAAQVWRWLIHGPPGEFQNALFHLRGRERIRDGLAYATSVVFEPTVADWQSWSLPSAAASLYYTFRPVRLAGKYGGRLLARLGLA